MKVYKDIVQGSEEWFYLRLGKFTCSDAQAILTNGKGLDTLAFTKVAEKLTKKIADGYTNDAMERGKELEDLARSAYELETGEVVEKIGFIEHSDWVGGSPDGLIKTDGLVEIKCPTDRVFVEYMFFKKIDPKYMAQMQMQLLISERKWVDYVVFNPNFEKQLIIRRVNRDEEMLTKLHTGIASGIERAVEVLSSL